MSLEEELEAIQAIYCDSEEFVMHQNGSEDRECIFTMKVKSEDEEHYIQITFTISSGYPSVCPKLSLRSNMLIRDYANKLKSDALSYAQTLIDQPMIMDIIMWFKENLSRYCIVVEDLSQDSQANEAQSEDLLWTALLHLDHMRAKTKYTKTIQKWTYELNLTGGLIFCDKLILILLQGHQRDIKEYIVRQKTVNVDVDSKGRSCKERMMTVLVDKPSDPTAHQFTKFSVVDLEPRNIEEQFAAWGIGAFYSGHVTTFLQR